MDWQTRNGRRTTFNTPGHAHELTFSCYNQFAFLRRVVPGICDLF